MDLWWQPGFTTRISQSMPGKLKSPPSSMVQLSPLLWVTAMCDFLQLFYLKYWAIGVATVVTASYDWGLVFFYDFGPHRLTYSHKHQGLWYLVLSQRLWWLLLRGLCGPSWYSQSSLLVEIHYFVCSCRSSFCDEHKVWLRVVGKFLKLSFPVPDAIYVHDSYP